MSEEVEVVLVEVVAAVVTDYGELQTTMTIDLNDSVIDIRDRVRHAFMKEITEGRVKVKWSSGFISIK